MALSAPPRPTFLPAADVAERLFRISMWDTPRAILNSVFAPNSRTAVKACHASSKTHTAAIAVALALYEGADVLTTAPTWEQVRTVLWGECHRLLAGGLIPMAQWGSVNQTEITMPDGSRALGLSTDQAVRFQGWHARPGSFLLIVMDEAPGVRPDIYEAVEGISAGGDVRLLLLGNPVTAAGPFYDIFASPSPAWSRYTIDALDTPNLRGLSLPDVLALRDGDLDLSERPYLVTRRWVVERHADWGVGHPLWQSRVRGAFPLQSDDALLSLAWLEAAAARPAIHDPSQPVQAGVDVAGPGEAETVLCVRQGDAILAVQAYPQADSRGEVIAALQRWPSLESVNVDVAGIGHYFAEALTDAGLPVVRINVGEAPAGRSPRETEQAKQKYANLRAQAFWSFREWASEGMLSGLTDRTTLSQLAGLRYSHDHRGRIAIERKADALKRGVTSPDRAEAVVLAFWSQPRSLLGAALGDALRGAEPSTLPQRGASESVSKVAAPPPRNPHPIAGDTQFQGMLERFGVRLDDG